MLADFAVVGTKCPTNSSSEWFRFSDRDLAVVQNQKGLDKIKRLFDRTPYRFNLYIVYVPDLQQATYASWRQNLDIEADVKQALGRPIDRKNTITAFYTNNATVERNYVPLTAWILAHRLHHGAAFGSGNFVEYHQFEHSITSFMSTVASGISTRSGGGQAVRASTAALAYSHALTRTPTAVDSYLCNANEIDVIRLNSLLFTMRSARTHRLTNHFEFPAELFAQYIITGSIKLTRASQWNIENFTPRYISSWETDPNNTQNKREIKSRYREFDEIYNIPDCDALDEFIDQYESRLNRECKALLDAMVGNIYGW